MKQREFVMNVINGLKDQGLEGNELKIASYHQVALGLISGECEHSKGPMIEKDAHKYGKAVVDDRFKKDISLNGGEKYVPETPRGPIFKDPKLKELKQNIKDLELQDPTNPLIEKGKAKIAEWEQEILAQRNKKTTPPPAPIEDILQKLQDDFGISA